MTQLVTQGRKSNYSAREVTEALVVLAWCSGNTRKAARELKKDGTPVPAGTLEKWKYHTHSADYKRIVEDELPKIYSRVAERCEGLAQDQADVEEKILRHLDGQVKDLEPRESANALQKVAVAKAVNIDKASLVRGKPTTITEHRDASDIIRAMSARFPGIVKVESVQGEAVEATADGD